MGFVFFLKKRYKQKNIAKQQFFGCFFTFYIFISKKMTIFVAQK